MIDTNELRNLISRLDQGVSEMTSMVSSAKAAADQAQEQAQAAQYKAADASEVASRLQNDLRVTQSMIEEMKNTLSQIELAAS